MPQALSYPGVYVEELPSGSRTITGVSTSITAFIGRCLKGPTNEPIVINSFADFERTFGGLWLDSTLGYAVRDFYLNGGSQAIIVRAYQSSGSGIASLALDDLILEAVNPGAWANNYGAKIETADAQYAAEVASSLNVQASDLFKLVIYRKTAGQAETVETYPYLTLVDSANRIDKVLEHNSNIFKLSASVDLAELTTPTASATTDYATAGSDGDALTSDAFIGTNYATDKKGLYALLKADMINMLCIPPYKANGNVDATVVSEAIAFCEQHRIFYLIDAPNAWKSKIYAVNGIKASNGSDNPIGSVSANAAIFFPRLKMPNPLRNNQVEEYAPCGAVAGTIARTDAQRGIWKAPAGIEATLAGISDLTVNLTDAETGELNPLGVNCLRTLSAAGTVVWGARTRKGNDQLASEWKYIPVRRLALYIEESLYRGMQWAVFEPNDEPLWRQITLNVDGFMNRLFRQGAFQGGTAKEAYFVKCNKETTTQDDINNGIVNVMVGFAPLKPAEFVVIKLQQIAGQTQA